MGAMLEEYENIEEETLKDRYLTFLIDKECYGIEVRYITEIVGIQPITVVPEVPQYVKGIINLRGKIIPVMDVRLRFKKEPKEYNDRTCIVVVDVNGVSIGLIVDSVSEVLTIPEHDIVDPPTINRNQSNKYIKRIGKVKDEVKLLLEIKSFKI